uniref:helix-turn-helix domain-containing protein n=1 Tax=Microbacterium proteolyticum TaxID=1572644 RepID=UPI0024171191|nr:helix-turn-helix domain-containing protein [Microbacterium proteolyticum]
MIDADHLDAIMAVEQVIGADVDWLANQDSGVEWLSELILDRHKPAPDGTRESWSVQDVMDRWGLEDKPEPHRYVFPDDEPDAEVALPVREWFDPLLDVKQAAKQAGVTVRAVQKWVKEGRLTPVARLRAGDGNVHTYFRASDIENTNHADGGL